MAFSNMSSQPLKFLIIFHLFIIFYSSIGSSYDLIHRDSSLSPFYNPLITHFDRLQESFKRSFSRVNHLKTLATTQTSMKPGGGEYLMKMSLGTPPIEVVGIVDTGSHLTWTQCLPCIQCYNQTIPLFDPTHSSSYNNLTRATNFCQELPQDLSIENKTLACGYKFAYGDGSHTSGILATETLTLDTSSLQNFAFGCAHNTAGIFDESGSGIIGLSSNEVSLISQLGPSIGKKFSYCLVPTSINTTSKISFGNDSVVLGSGSVTTPIQISNDSLYYLTLEAISVGTERIVFPQSPNYNQGNIVIDSGTILTLVPPFVFSNLLSALDKLMNLEKVNEPMGVLSACYKTSSNFGEKIQLPLITMHFKGGADVEMKPVNMFSWVSNDVLCFTMVANDDLTIYGNLAQANFQIGYDLDVGTLSFTPTDCALEHL